MEAEMVKLTCSSWISLKTGPATTAVGMQPSALLGSPAHGPGSTQCNCYLLGLELVGLVALDNARQLRIESLAAIPTLWITMQLELPRDAESLAPKQPSCFLLQTAPYWEL